MSGAVEKTGTPWRRRAGRKRCCSEARLALRDEGFDVFEPDREDPVASVIWRDVRSIRTYKWDVFAYDIICLAFESNKGSWAVITEKDEGFAAVRQEMEARFPEIPDTWFWDVAVPAFATNNTLLYPHDELSYQRQIAEQRAAQPSPKPDSLSLGDGLSAICGAFAFGLLYGVGHPILVVAAAVVTALTVLGGIGIRRMYHVQDVPDWFRQIVVRNVSPEKVREVVDHLLRNSYVRVVPSWVRSGYLIVKLSNPVLLIIGFSLCITVAKRG